MWEPDAARLTRKCDDSVCKILFVEWTEKEDGLANTGVAEGEGFVELDNGETEDFGLRFEKLSNNGHAHAVAIVFDDGEDGASGNAAGDFGNVVAKIFAMDFDPGIEGRVLRSRRFWERRGRKLGSGMQDRGKSETGRLLDARTPPTTSVMSRNMVTANPITTALSAAVAHSTG